MQLPEHPGELLAGWSAELGATWQYMAALVQAGDINVDTDGRLHAAALEAIAEPASLRDLRNTARKMMPKADIGDVVQEVISWHPEFIASYTHISGGPNLR